MSLQSFDTQQSLSELSLSLLSEKETKETCDEINITLKKYIDKAKFKSHTNVIDYIEKVNKLSRFVKNISETEDDFKKGLMIQKINKPSHSHFFIDLPLDDSFDMNDNDNDLSQLKIDDDDYVFHDYSNEEI